MQGTQAGLTMPSLDLSRTALDFVHRLLSLPAARHVALDELVGELATAFGVPAAGLASLRDGTTIVPPADAGADALARRPWEEDPALRDRIRQAAIALTVPRPEGGSYLVSAFAVTEDGWLLWLGDDRRDAWDETEAATLALAGGALARRLTAGLSPRWAEQLHRAALQQQLENAASVARRLAHDFGNVLTSILGFSELALTQQVPPSTPLHSYLTEVHRGAQNGANLTDRLRLFARRQSASTFPRPASLAAVLAEEGARLRAGREPGFGLDVTLPSDLPAVAIDADHLRQVLAAFLDNARDALAGAGTITVRARTADLAEADGRDYFGAVRPGPHVEVSIADSGGGLSPEASRRLFAEPFFSTKPRCRGFGLAIAYGVLHAHGGGLRLEPGPERGTVARFVVPVATIAAAAAPAGPDRGEKVLVVDDDPMILQFVSTTLEGAGYRVEAVTSAEDALASYTTSAGDPFRLVLSDVIMPRTSGVDLARRLLHHDANVRVLFMSGRVSVEFPQQDFARHQFELLPKPFRPEGLLRAVRQALDRTAPRRGGPGEVGEEPVLSSSR